VDTDDRRGRHALAAEAALPVAPGAMNLPEPAALQARQLGADARRIRGGPLGEQLRIAQSDIELEALDAADEDREVAPARGNGLHGECRFATQRPCAVEADAHTPTAVREPGLSEVAG